MNKCLVALLLLTLYISCGKQKEDGKTEEMSRRFKKVVLLKTTPVKNQGHSGLCWAYAMLATIETEHLMQGDSVNLSVDYVARHFLKEQMMEQCINASARRQQVTLTTRGMSSMLLRLIHTYGLTHYDSYNISLTPDPSPKERGTLKGGHGADYGVICRQLQQMAASPQFRGDRLSASVDSFLDEQMGPLPRFVFMLGAEYTALEYAHSVCRVDEYEQITSFLHHPFYQRFPLEVPDNRYHDTFLNVPLDTMMAAIDRTLLNGHPVCWEGDISEKGFRWSAGIAELDDEIQPTNGKPLPAITQEQRLKAFVNGKTTDDHCMEIVGIAYKVQPKKKASPQGGGMDGAPKYYVMKNSWGTNNAYRGYMVVSERYVRMKTVAIYVPH